MTYASLRQAGVDVIVSTLTGPEAEELGLVAEAQECLRNGLLFISLSKIDLCRHMSRSSQSWWTGRWNTQEQGNP